MGFPVEDRAVRSACLVASCSAMTARRCQRAGEPGSVTFRQLQPWAYASRHFFAAAGRICEGLSGGGPNVGKLQRMAFSGDVTGTQMSRQTLTVEENRTHAVRVREALARQRLSRETLAARARVSLSTLEKGLSGQRPFTLATLVRLETALGLTLRPNETSANHAAQPLTHGNAPDDLGGYNRASVGWLEGAYLTVLPSFGERGAIYAFRTDIAWDAAQTRLTFREAERLDRDFVQFGSVSVPLQSGHIYLLTNRHGQVRLIMLARPLISGAMHGLLTTLQAGRGSHLSPVSCPIVLRPLQAGEQPVYGRIRPSDAVFAAYHKLLARTVADGFATFIGDAPPIA